jgi:hypothetical protein
MYQSTGKSFHTTQEVELTLREGGMDVDMKHMGGSRAAPLLARTPAQ